VALMTPAQIDALIPGPPDVGGLPNGGCWMLSGPSRYFTLAWRKSKFSGSGADCVEVADAESLILVRDSHSRETALAFPAAQWSAFMRRVQADGELRAS
jgi:hypothetical protein